jgi:hypothetical protein
MALDGKYSSFTTSSFYYISKENFENQESLGTRSKQLYSTISYLTTT